MKYWASNFAIIPIEKGLSAADPGMVWEKKWIPPSITSRGLCGEHPRNLFLQLLMGSLFLIAAYQPARAEVKVVHSCIRVCAHSPSKLAACPAKSNIKHQTSNITNAPKQEVLGEKCEVRNTKWEMQNSNFQLLPSEPRTPNSEFRTPNPEFRTPNSTSCVGTGLPSVASEFRIPNSELRLPPSPFPLPTSNGALLAHQTTSVTKPLPAARNGVAISTPLPEARDIKKMINHFQICTQGYSASPGIPIPASGLWDVRCSVFDVRTPNPEPRKPQHPSTEYRIPNTEHPNTPTPPP